ncbi:hypothetical protein C0992_007182 [Termitomyces sp. T32_za158]|nr:hypothetical protein C0992_007182 [Termitomyces sp. T32_za158]
MNGQRPTSTTDLTQSTDLLNEWATLFPNTLPPSHALLALAVQSGSAPIAARILSRGANSRSVFDLAVINALTETVETLIAAGAQIKNTNALKVAGDYGRIEMIELLLNHGAQIDEIPNFPEMLN